MRISIRQSATNPLFNMAISQARDGNIFPQQQQQQIPRAAPPPPPPPPQQQIDYQFLKQFEQLLISRQIPPQERIGYIQAMVERMQRGAIHMPQQQQQPTRVSRYSSSSSPN